MGCAESARQAARYSAVLLLRLALDEELRAFILELSGVVARQSVEEEPAAGLLLSAFMGCVSAVLRFRASGTSKAVFLLFWLAFGVAQVVCAKIVGQMARHLPQVEATEAVVKWC